MTLALFDLDHTLLDGDSELLWSQFMQAHGQVGSDFVTTMESFFADYETGTLDFVRYQAFLLSPFAHRPLHTLLDLRDQYLEEYIRPRLRPLMRERVIRHRAENHTLLIVTAANAFFARPIARLLHMPHLICTELETDGQVPTGAVRGTPAFREGKVIRLQTWLNEHHNCMEGSWVYSDSHNDLPLLELAEHPVAVAPDARLRAHAARLGWEILDP